MKNKSYYIYKITDKNDLVLYVGQTSNINKRIRNHINDKYWIRDGYRFYTHKCLNKTDADIYEIYYINKYKSFYNKQNSNNVDFSINLKEVEFKLYKVVMPEDLFTRNEKYERQADLHSSKICLDILKNIGFDKKNNFKDVGFQGSIIDGVPISYIKTTLTNDVIVEFFLKNGLHELFIERKGESRNRYFQNLEVFLFMVWSACEGKNHDDIYSIWLDDCSIIEQFKLVNTKESDIY